MISAARSVKTAGSVRIPTMPSQIKYVLASDIGGTNMRAALADRSRDLGNHIHFCRWRQIERLIVLMSVGRAVGTVH